MQHPERLQVVMEASSLDERLSMDDPARLIWAAVRLLDLGRLEETIHARGETPGRPAIPPAVLLALWLYAATNGIGSAREIARLCESHDGYRWIRGGIGVNHHALSDFRMEHGAELDELLAQVIARLVHQDIVKVERIAQDGTRVRASAGSSSFHRAQTLQEHLTEARAHVEALKRQDDSGMNVREAAARARAASERVQRLEAALQEMPAVQEVKRRTWKGKPGAMLPPRVSSTDPEARVMRMGDGGMRPAYNVQLATDTASRAIVGVTVLNCGSDANQAGPMRAQVEQLTGKKVKEHLADTGYAQRESIEQAAQAGVTLYTPPQPHKSGRDPYAPCAKDTPAQAAWRAMMATDEAKTIYQERAAVAETVNADLKSHRGLDRLLVRGLIKVKAAIVIGVLAYNLMHFASVLISPS